MSKPKKSSFSNVVVAKSVVDVEQPHNGTRTANLLAMNGQIPRPKNFLELAQHFERFQPTIEYPPKLLRLLHFEKVVSFDRIRVFVYDGRPVADYLNVVNAARRKILELPVPYRIDTYFDDATGQTMVKMVECPDV